MRFRLEAVVRDRHVVTWNFSSTNYRLQRQLLVKFSNMQKLLCHLSFIGISQWRLNSATRMTLNGAGQTISMDTGTNLWSGPGWLFCMNRANLIRQLCWKLAWLNYIRVSGPIEKGFAMSVLGRSLLNHKRVYLVLFDFNLIGWNSINIHEVSLKACSCLPALSPSPR